MIKNKENNNKEEGLQITVFIDSINKAYDEYLVDFEYLRKKLEKLGFKLINSDDFETLYKKYNTTEKEHIMSEKERELSFLNRQFVFQKKVSEETTAPVVEETVAPVVEEIAAPKKKVVKKKKKKVIKKKKRKSLRSQIKQVKFEE